jgi:hypothetical protein
MTPPPPSATSTETVDSSTLDTAVLRPGPPNENQRPVGGTSAAASVQMMNFPRPPKFEDKHEEQKYLKERLAAAFRIFGKYGFDEGVAGHITLRVRFSFFFLGRSIVIWFLLLFN